MPPLFQELQLGSILRTVITYNAAISACEEGQPVTTVPPLFQKFQLRGLLRNVITYGAAISAGEKGQEPQHAPYMFPEIADPRPPAGRDHLQRGHQRMRDGPQARTEAA